MSKHAEEIRRILRLWTCGHDDDYITAEEVQDALSRLADTMEIEEAERSGFIGVEKTKEFLNRQAGGIIEVE